MSNVIKVDFKGEGEKNGYSTLDNQLIGVINMPTNMEMCANSNGLFQIFKDGPAELERKEMAEWLWMAAYLLDSEGRYKFDEYVGLNYDDKGKK